MPLYGVICLPVKIPETDPKDPTKTIEIEQTVCYPAPPPPPEATPKPIIPGASNIPLAPLNTPGQGSPTVMGGPNTANQMMVNNEY